MKKIIPIVASFLLLCSFKGDVPVNPEFFGLWRCVKPIKDQPTKSMVYDWDFRQNAKSNKIDVYRKKDPDGQPFITVKMLDATHFEGKTVEKIDDNQSIDHKITGYYEENKFIILDHLITSIYNGSVTNKKAHDWKYEFRKFSKAKNEYPAFPDLRPTEVFDKN
jgi:hypothetical protein